MRASPMKRSGYSASSSATSSLEAPNGTARTMPMRSIIATYSASAVSGRGSPPSRRERKIRS